MQPQNTEVMDALADVCMQLGDYERASELWTTSTRNAPTANPYKWLYLAQLQTDEAALDSYNRGIEFLTSQSSAASEEKVWPLMFLTNGFRDNLILCPLDSSCFEQANCESVLFNCRVVLDRLVVSVSPTPLDCIYC